MAEKVRAAVLHGPRDLRLEDRELQPPGPNEAQIAVRAVGLCGSDVHYYQDYRLGSMQVKEPMVLGHECAGVVVAVGPDVYNVQVGDPVALEVGFPCGNCHRCKEGRYNICADLEFRGSAKTHPHVSGALQDKINHPAKWCYRLPRGVHLTMGALIEPLSVAIHAFKRAQLNSKSRPKVLVFGAGPIGLLCAAVCRYNEANLTAIADIRADRLDFARDHGFATDVVHVQAKDCKSNKESMEQAKEIAMAAREVQERTANGFDVVFECTGAEVCSQASVLACRPGGKVILVGMGPSERTLPISEAIMSEIDILGSFRYANIYPIAIDLVARARTSLPGLHALITHSFPGLDMAVPAFEAASKSQDEHDKLVLKVIIIMGDSN